MRRRRVLESAARELRLPLRERRRLLYELESDSEAMYAHYLRRGDDPETALRKVESCLDVTGRSAAELGTVHMPVWHRLVRRFAPGREDRVEWWMLSVVIVVLMGMGAEAMSRSILSGSPLSWVVLIPGVSCGAAIGVKLFQIIVKRDDTPVRMRAGLRWLWVLGVLVSVAAVAAVVTSLWLLLGRGIGSTDVPAPGEIWGWVRQAATLLAGGFATGAGALLVWFALAGRADAIERAESEFIERRSTWSVF